MAPLLLALITQILLRLPVKSLLRFTTVCKQWRDTITSASFAHNHYHHETNQSLLLVGWRGIESLLDVEASGILLFMDEMFERYEEHDHLQLTQEIDILTVPCNGVFCFTTKSYELFLWNSSTRKVRQLSPQMFKNNDGLGFGVDPSTNEFKIVLIHTSPHVSIYTSSNDSWRYLENQDILKNSLISDAGGEYGIAKGVLYWRKFNTGTSNSIILAFDLRSEVFTEIELPNELRNEMFRETIMNDDGSMLIKNDSAQRVARLDCLEDSLAMICYDHDTSTGAGNRVLDVWVMKEQGCWIRTHILQPPFSFLETIGFLESRELIFVTMNEPTDNEELVLYDPDSGKTRTLKVPLTDYGIHTISWVFDYKESIFPV